MSKGKKEVVVVSVSWKVGAGSAGVVPAPAKWVRRCNKLVAAYVKRNPPEYEYYQADEIHILFQHGERTEGWHLGAPGSVSKIVVCYSGECQMPFSMFIEVLAHELAHAYAMPDDKTRLAFLLCSYSDRPHERYAEEVAQYVLEKVYDAERMKPKDG